MSLMAEIAAGLLDVATGALLRGRAVSPGSHTEGGRGSGSPKPKSCKAM